MSFEKREAGTFRVIRWCPGLKGFRRYANLRTMTRDGQLWFVTRDVEKALALTKSGFHKRRIERLEGNTWGTTTAQWQGKGPRLLFNSLTALTVATAGRRNRLDWSFVRWLDSLEDVAQPVDAGDFVDDLPTDAEHSGGAYLQDVVEHAFA